MTKTAKELKFDIEIAVEQVKSIEGEIADYTARLKELVKSDLSNLDDDTFEHIVALGGLISNKEFELHRSLVRMYTLQGSQIYIQHGERYLYQPRVENDEVLDLQGWNGLSVNVSRTLTLVGQDTDGKSVWESENGGLYRASKPFVIERARDLSIQDVSPINETGA